MAKFDISNLVEDRIPDEVEQTVIEEAASYGMSEHQLTVFGLNPEIRDLIKTVSQNVINGWDEAVDAEVYDDTEEGAKDYLDMEWDSSNMAGYIEGEIDYNGCYDDAIDELVLFWENIEATCNIDSDVLRECAQKADLKTAFYGSASEDQALEVAEKLIPEEYWA